MLFGIITLITALCIAGVAAWFSIAGLMAIFSAAALPIAVMAGTLEVGKLLTASWLYRYWHDTGIALKSYLSIAVVVLMLITSMGIFGYLSKAHLDQAGVSGDALATVERIEGQIAREENKINILQQRINGLDNTGTGVTLGVDQQEDIRNTAWEQVQGDIDYNQQQIVSVRQQLAKDLDALDSRESALNNRLAELDKAVSDLRNKGVEVITTDQGGAFRRAETETIDYVEQANSLRDSQSTERDEIANQKSDLDTQRQSLRTQANTDIKTFQSAIDRYRSQAQSTINSANAEINRIREQTTQNQDSVLAQIDDYNAQIDQIYDNIVVLKDEKFEAESVVRELEKEVGPIKYVAQLLFGGDGEELLDKAVQVFILMLVFVFDPLAVMLVIAANQTLLRYGINLEKAGPDDDRDNNCESSSTDTPTGSGETLSEGGSENTTEDRGATDNDIHLQREGESGDVDSTEPVDQPSSVDDAAIAMMESAARIKDKEIVKLKRELKKKPKQVVVEKEVEKIIEKEPELNIDLTPPKSILELEKKLQKRLNKDGD